MPVDPQGKKNRRWEHLRVPYRLVVMNNETFEEIGSYRLTLLNIYVAICSLLLLGAILIWLLVFFTPLKRLVPGYGDVTSSGEFIKIERKLRSAEEELSAYKLYYEKVRGLITGPQVAATSETEMSSPQIQADQEPVTRIPEDEELRDKVETEDALTISPEEFINSRKPDRELYEIYFVPPVNGEISAPFMPDKEHFGVDVLAPKNTPVRATMDGYVIASDWTLETGYTIGIQHDNNLISFYKHNSVLLKKVGEPVKAGEAIAIIGNTGTLSDGPHLHFELWQNGKPINPADYIRF
ncbi:MAG: M23 family metallopeptidase [Saprospiraceae bacterium]|nr:M23 family metallopeptidase [Saprospiraceae bacterium]MCB9322024.1 M23 family metallopeptidase [Lewinellaceae bacterium]